MMSDSVPRCGYWFPRYAGIGVFQVSGLMVAAGSPSNWAFVDESSEALLLLRLVSSCVVVMYWLGAGGGKRDVKGFPRLGVVRPEPNPVLGCGVRIVFGVWDIRRLGGGEGTNVRSAGLDAGLDP